MIKNQATDTTKRTEAEAAQKAIKDAAAAKLLADDATNKYQSADDDFKTIELKVTAANQIKTDAAAKLATSTTEMNNATAALSNLETVTTTTVDIPAFEQKLPALSNKKSLREPLHLIPKYRAAHKMWKKAAKSLAALLVKMAR